MAKINVSQMTVLADDVSSQLDIVHNYESNHTKGNLRTLQHSKNDRFRLFPLQQFRYTLICHLLLIPINLI